ncbi:MAG: S24 family peptidase [Alphaproteobacteria bacterium]|nr:S24 family peptidase [Alphaproteobacteria bacterium]
MDLDPVRLRVIQLLDERRTDMKNGSLALGRNPAYLHQFVFRGTPKVLGEDDRAALAAFLECDEDELRHKARPERKPRAKSERAPRANDGQPEGYLAIPEIDVRAAAGAGAVHDGLEETKDVWYFSDPVVRHEFRARPSDLRMITIDGDSMEPMLDSGDRIMIDTSQRVPVPPGVFVIWDGMGLVAKRVEHAPNSDPPVIIIKSVNPDYETYERDAEEVHVIGRVIWAAKRF